MTQQNYRIKQHSMESNEQEKDYRFKDEEIKTENCVKRYRSM
jgi:hypothetical protein